MDLTVRYYYYDVYGKDLAMDYYWSTPNSPCSMLYNHGSLTIWL